MMPQLKAWPLVFLPALCLAAFFFCATVGPRGDWFLWARRNSNPALHLHPF